jgi:hypothetical protein
LSASKAAATISLIAFMMSLKIRVPDQGDSAPLDRPFSPKQGGMAAFAPSHIFSRRIGPSNGYFQ